MQARRQGSEAAAGGSGLTRDDAYLLDPREGREGLERGISSRAGKTFEVE